MLTIIAESVKTQTLSFRNKLFVLTELTIDYLQSIVYVKFAFTRA